MANGKTANPFTESWRPNDLPCQNKSIPRAKNEYTSLEPMDTTVHFSTVPAVHSDTCPQRDYSTAPCYSTKKPNETLISLLKIKKKKRSRRRILSKVQVQCPMSNAKTCAYMCVRAFVCAWAPTHHVSFFTFNTTLTAQGNGRSS